MASIFRLKSTTLDIEDISTCIVERKSNDLIFDLLNTENFEKVENFNIKESKRLSVCTL